jgi:RHS repeat-associated protein
MLLMKTTNGVVTKYVYGTGLIGEEVSGAFKTYHFDRRGSTIAITDASGNITDTFAYDTYGKLLTRTGTNKVIFGYIGRDGVVTDDNGLIYMRARYYSPKMKRFVNADIVAGQISNAITLNRFAYANGNPVSFVDPFGLVAENKDGSSKTIDREEYINAYMSNTDNALYQLLQTWGFSLTKSVDAAESTYIDVLWGGFVVKLYVDISFATPLDTDVNIDVNVDSGDINHEVTTPELKIPWTDIGTKVGAYVDGGRLSVGASAYVSNDGWTFGSKHQIGLYSEANITTISYEPDDGYLPTVSISLDAEVNHLAKLAVAGIAVAAVYAPSAIVAAAPTAAEFIQQLGSMAPAFAH